jgi:hypothetical protein
LFPREYYGLLFIEDQAFSPPIRLLAALFHQKALPATHRKTETERQYADGRGEGVGAEPNQTMARKSGPL